MITAAFTGHRPERLGGYSPAIEQALYALATATLRTHAPDQVISGMALGWDQAVARAALDLKIPTLAAIPFAGQECVWPAEARARYHALLGRCSARHTVSVSPYSAHKLHLRDQWMVDHSVQLIALWDGLPTGGTYSTVRYAEREGKPVVNVWPAWLAAQPGKKPGAYTL